MVSSVPLDISPAPVLPFNRSPTNQSLGGVRNQNGSKITLTKDDLKVSAYTRVLDLLATDQAYQREVALGKRIGFYKLGEELGTGNFSKVKVGAHILTKGKKGSYC